MGTLLDKIVLSLKIFFGLSFSDMHVCFHKIYFCKRWTVNNSMLMELEMIDVENFIWLEGVK